MSTSSSHDRYDVFVAHSYADEAWVEEWLTPRLKAAGLRVCLASHDFDIGVPRLINIERAVDHSRRTLVVLSPSWVAGEWSQFEALLTQTADPAARQRRLLPLLLHACQPPQRIAMLSYADFTQQDEWEAQLERVVAATRDELHLPEVGPPLGRLLGAGDAPFLVPFMRNPDFVGRTIDLVNLHSILIGTAPVGIRPAGLTGMGGIGKTQLAVEYAYRYRDAYPDGVFWINAAEPLAANFARLGKRLRPNVADRPLDDQIRAAADELQSRPAALLIVDNLADPAELNRSVSSDLVPIALPCRLLFTTRRRDLDRFHAIEVTVLPEAAALRLLLRHPSQQAIFNPNHPQHGAARTICAILGYLPLGLEVAGAHLSRRPDAPLSTYCQELLHRGALPVLDDPRGRLKPEDLPTRHDAAVGATLASQWDILEDNARLLLRVAGQQPEAAVVPAARLGLLAGLSDKEAGWFAPAPLSAALRELEDDCLVQELREDMVRLHPLVDEFAARQTPEAQAPAFRRWCAANLAAAYETFATLEDHCSRRGIDDLQEDLIAALQLLTPQSADPTQSEDEVVRVRLQSLLRLLQRESHNLRDWRRDQRPAFLAQQVHNRAVEMELTDLATSSVAWLAQLQKPYLLPIWRVGPESPELERTLTGHSSGVSAATITPDGRWVVSGAYDRTLKIWDLQTGEEVGTMRGHGAEIHALAILPDGQSVISASQDRTLRVWNLRTRQQERTLTGHKDSINSVAVTPYGRRAVSASDDHTLKVWDLTTCREELTLHGHSAPVHGVTVTPDGRRAVSASDDRTLKVWDMLTGREELTLHGHSAPVRGLAVTPDGRRAVSASNDHTLKVWNLLTGHEEHTLRGHTLWVRAVVVTPDGHRAISASQDRTLKVWDLQTGREERTFFGHSARVRGLAVTPDGRRVISASHDRTLKVWDLLSRQKQQASSGHTTLVRSVAIEPNGRRTISTSADRSLKVWDLQTGREEYTLNGHTASVSAVAVIPNQQQAVSASSDHTIKVWDLQSGQELQTLRGHSDAVYDIAVTPNGGIAVSASVDHTLKVWDISLGRELHTLAGHRAAVHGVSITPDGLWALSASEDRSIKVWDLSTGQELRALHGHRGKVNVVRAIPKDLRVISASDDQTLKIWDWLTGQTLYTLRGHTDEVKSVAVTPDGRRAVSAAADCTLKVWDLEVGQEIASFALDSAIECIAIAADGETLVAGDRAGNVYCLRCVG